MVSNHTRLVVTISKNFFSSLSVVLLMIHFTLLSVPSVHAEAACDNTKRRTFSVYIENDVFTGKDEQYTNGLKFTMSRYGLAELPEDAWFHKWLYPVIRKIKFDEPPGSEKILTLSVGQSIYTPKDLETSELIQDDRPYAGITYIEFGFHRKYNYEMHTLGLFLGVVGPSSYADEIQTYFHDIIGSKDPQGWEHQLKNEPVVNLVYDYKKKLIYSGINSGVGGDIIYNSGAALGNAMVFCQMGMLTRFGWNIPNDCGNFPIQPATCFNAEHKDTCSVKNTFGAHLFLSVAGSAVLHNIFLDGNTFQDSHSVEKEMFVCVFSGGIGIITGRFKTVLSYVNTTRSFKGQTSGTGFGSINITFRY